MTPLLCPVIGAIVAIITGNKAKREIQESGGAIGGETLAKIGVILGYVNVGLFVLGVCISVGLMLLGPGLAGVLGQLG